MRDRTNPGREVSKRVSYRDAEETAVSTLILEAVASIIDADPRELPPLYEYVDPEALDALVAHHHHQPVSANGLTLEFAFEQFEVVVSGDGEFVVLEPTA